MAMQPTIPSARTSLLANVSKHWPFHREVNLFGLHYVLWVVFSLISGWFAFQLPLAVQKQFSESMAVFHNNWAGYVHFSLVGDFLYLLTIHMSYWLFQRLVPSGTVWKIALFAAYGLAYIFLVSAITGFLYAYFAIPVKKEEAFQSVIVVWIYMLVFIVVRTIRQYRRNQRTLETQRTQAELEALKSQINPHFLFNTLNNLYGTAVSGDTNRTAAGIEQLSSVMRHVTEAAKQPVIPLNRELRFVEDIVELHRMRLPNQTSIDIQCLIEQEAPPANSPVQIVPLLLNPLVENAFKYGISLQHPSFVHIQIRAEHDRLDVQISNSIHTGSGLEKGTGSGLNNVRQRLKLAYPERHSLKITDGPAVFSVSLLMHL